MIRIQTRTPRLGDERVVRKFIFLPKTLPVGSEDSLLSETRWLGFSYIRQRLAWNNFGAAKRVTKWHDACFEDAPEVNMSATRPVECDCACKEESDD